MKVNKFKDNKACPAPANHFDMNGFPVFNSGKAVVGYSFYLPGGGTEMIPAPLEMYYHVLEGEMTISMETGETIVLTQGDTIMFEPGDVKKSTNTGLGVARILVISVKA